MPDLLSSALLGGAKGFSQGMVNISDEQRKQLAEKLKMEAQAALNAQSQQAGFAQQEKMAGINAQYQGGLLEKESGLRRQETQEELKAKKEMGILEPRPTVLGPGQVAVDPVTGKTIATGQTKPTPGVEPKAADKIRAQKEASDIIANLTKPKNKGGAGLEPGDEIPQIYLNRINSILESAGEAPITQTIIPKVPGYLSRKFGWIPGVEGSYRETKQKPSAPSGAFLEESAQQQTSDQKAKQFADKWGINF